MLPFGKTASGTFGGGTRKPTNTIVDFYVEKIVNLPGQPFDATVNGGRPYAVFRINYEDVEQGNDHDMDAIVRYLINANADGTVTVTLNSEYAAGSADQNMGYRHVRYAPRTASILKSVIPIPAAGSFLPYALNTPNPVLPGGCGVATPPAACNSQLPLTSTRVFTPAAAGATGGADPPQESAVLRGEIRCARPQAPSMWMAMVFRTTTSWSPIRRRCGRSSTRHFADIINNSQPTASVATSTPRYVPGATLAYEASYKSLDWSGDIKAYRLRSDGTYDSGGTEIWSASGSMPGTKRTQCLHRRAGQRWLQRRSRSLRAASTPRCKRPCMGTLDPADLTISTI